VRVTALEAIPYALPFKEPYVTAKGTLDRREMVLVRLQTDDGPTGLGEAVPLSLRGGASLESVVTELERLGDRIADEFEKSLDPARLRGMTTTLSPPAAAAVEIALLDLWGQESDRRAGERLILGGFDDRPILCNATLIAAEPDEVAEDARAWAAEGFSTFKLKVGAGDDVARVRAVRAVIGPEAKIRLDANGVWDLATAKRVLSDVEELEIELVEQPVATLEEMTELAETTPIPIAADESVVTVADAVQAAQTRACEWVGVKLARVGGPRNAMNIGSELRPYVSSALDGPVGIAAAAHVVQALRAAPHPRGIGIAHGLATQRLFAETIASVECELRGDQLHLPAGPGLGVEIDERALERRRL
jgi:o-succinylbenzoate synthase